MNYWGSQADSADSVDLCAVRGNPGDGWKHGGTRHLTGAVIPRSGVDDFDKYRRLIRARGITPKIARRGTPHGSGLGKTRWVVERTFAWLHQFKRLRTRYEIRADLHLALLQLACSIICLRRLRTSF